MVALPNTWGRWWIGLIGLAAGLGVVILWLRPTGQRPRADTPNSPEATATAAADKPRSGEAGFLSTAMR